ncbi:MAG: hypothetical protein ACK4S4_15670 [Pyrinomonadaceae bacterium]
MTIKLLTQSYDLWMYVYRNYTYDGIPRERRYSRLVSRALRRFLRRAAKFRREQGL